MSPNVAALLDLYCRLDALLEAGAEDDDAKSPECDAIRDDCDLLWYSLTPAEHAEFDAALDALHAEREAKKASGPPL